MSNFRKNTLGMLGIAALTMVASLALMTPRFAGAADDDPTDTPKTAENLRKISAHIAMPTLEADGCTMTMKTDKESYTKGEKPILTVTVTNNSDKQVEKTIIVTMNASDLEQRSRLPAAPVQLFKDTRKVTLEAGESKTITIETNVEISDRKANFFQFGDLDTEDDELVDAPAVRRVERAVRVRN
ncbi:MAG: hypothetical protein KF696_09210 [Planctomycetes bacterium]|nr:hypothetical protein [Planctomycetota bacterium]MCW8136765.1 hypothetical protein [Planctomycetota bacterium]